MNRNEILVVRGRFTQQQIDDMPEDESYHNYLKCLTKDELINEVHEVVTKAHNVWNAVASELGAVAVQKIMKKIMKRMVV